jgi:cell division protein FtsB
MDVVDNLRHEIASVIIGAIVSWFGNKALRVAKDVQCLWPRLRALETEVAALKAANDKLKEGSCKAF